MSKVDIARTAKGLIIDPERWTQGAAIRDENGHHACPNAHPPYDSGYSYCLLGAIRSAAMRIGVDQEGEAAVMVDLEDQLHVISLANFNDTHTHAEVVAALDKLLLHYEGKKDEEEVQVAHRAPQEAPVLAGVSSS